MTLLFGSISSNPGSTGAYYYSSFFKYYGINAEYTPFKAKNLIELESHLSNKSYSGFNISMPYKPHVIKFLNYSSSEVENYNSCNTIKIEKNELHGFNTDLSSVLKIVSSISNEDYVLVLGNGAMGKMFELALQAKQIEFKVISPSLNNWHMRHQKCEDRKSVV